MMILADPEPNSILDAIDQAIDETGNMDVYNQHHRVKSMYSWERIAHRTLKVYDRVEISGLPDTLFARLWRYYRCGIWAGKIFCCVASLQHLYWKLLQYLYPEDAIDIAPDILTPLVA